MAYTACVSETLTTHDCSCPGTVVTPEWPFFCLSFFPRLCNLPSMALQEALQLMLKDGDVFKCHNPHKMGAAEFSAARASLAVLLSGANLDSLLLRYQGEVLFGRVWCLRLALALCLVLCLEGLPNIGAPNMADRAEGCCCCCLCQRPAFSQASSQRQVQSVLAGSIHLLAASATLRQ